MLQKKRKFDENNLAQKNSKILTNDVLNNDIDQNSIISLNQSTNKFEANENNTAMKMGYKDYFKFLKNTNLNDTFSLHKKFPIINTFQNTSNKAFGFLAKSNSGKFFFKF